MILSAALQAHRALLERWRVAMDLVGPGPLDPHFEDALAATRWIPAQGRWADLGSGAGFPGVALAEQHPGAVVSLVERRGKRAVFLEEVVAATGLSNLRVVQGDATKLSGPFDGVLSRAFLPPEKLLPLARKLLVPGGICVLLLAREEVAAGPEWERFHVERYRVEGKDRRAEGLRLRA